MNTGMGFSMNFLKLIKAENVDDAKKIYGKFVDDQKKLLITQDANFVKTQFRITVEPALELKKIIS